MDAEVQEDSHNNFCYHKNMLSQEKILSLIQTALQSREHAFTPLGESKVGACVLGQNGQIFEGCNVGSVISGLGVCAERAAMDHAVIHGTYTFAALVVVREDGIQPCGACLQYILQFYQINEKEITIIAADTKGNFTIHSLFELLPFGYVSAKHKEKLQSYNK